MNIAIYGKALSPDLFPYVQNLVDKLEKAGCNVFLYEPFFSVLREKISFSRTYALFTTHEEIHLNVDFLFSIGGDGALLDTITLVRDSGIPVLGVNMGRLGFLSSISKEEIIEGIDEILSKRFKLEKRTLLRLETRDHLFGDMNYAMNEVAVYKKIPNSMMTVHAYIDDNFVNSYWGDGLIVSTPTGSTGYSLSCGGPILIPGSENFVITPIATHNLTVRPIVIPDESVIRITVEGRQGRFYIGLDSRSVEVDSSTELIIRKEDFKINLLKMTNEDFFGTIRSKLNWGLDIRN